MFVGNQVMQRELHDRTPKTTGKIDDLEAQQFDQMKLDAREGRLIRYADDKDDDGIDIGKCVVCGLVGALCGVMLGVLIYANSDEVVRRAFWGLFIGGVSGFFIGASYFYIMAGVNDQHRKAAEERRRQLRREEMNQVEKHEEFVYYDAGMEHSLPYRLMCCPHFGKITSERMLYSEVKMPANLSKLSWWERASAWVSSLWGKKVESMDYDMVLDVSVEQSCLQFLTDTGTVILHCEASGDVSTIKDERERLINAIQNRDERQLKVSVSACASMPSLAPLLEEGRVVLDEVVAERRKDCEAKGIEFRPMFANDLSTSGLGAGNSSKVVRVRDVSHPYRVLDDLSYKITKQTKLDTRDRVLQSSAASSASAVNRDIVDKHSSPRPPGGSLVRSAADM